MRARYEAALAAGGTTVYEPSQQEWGAFAAQVADPDGHLWMILVSPDDWSASARGPPVRMRVRCAADARFCVDLGSVMQVAVDVVRHERADNHLHPRCHDQTVGRRPCLTRRAVRSAGRTAAGDHPWTGGYKRSRRSATSR